MNVLPEWSKNVAVTDDCWNWTGHVMSSGYGRLKRNGHSTLAHVLVYETLIGPVPDGLELHHRCQNKKCCNPWHLEPVTRSQHIRIEPRGNGRDVRTHCPRGHPYDLINTGWNARKKGKPFRYCKECNRQRYHLNKK
jgi:hypothetical protein